MNDVPETLGSWRERAAARLAGAGVEEPEALADWLAAEILGLPRLDLDRQAAHSLTEPEAQRLRLSLDRLARHEPLQYVLGVTPFYGLRLKTDARALIPRPETEELVEIVLKDPSVRAWRAPRIVDVGTGSGCIALALAVHRPDAAITGIDRSPEALALAAENAVALGLDGRVAWRQGDCLDGIPPGGVDLVVSNPPYIPRSECGVLAPHVRDYEPRPALDGGETGLDILAQLIGQAAALLPPGGMLYSEHGHDQGGAVAGLARRAGFSRVATIRDTAGHERFVRCEK